MKRAVPLMFDAHTRRQKKLHKAEFAHRISLSMNINGNIMVKPRNSLGFYIDRGCTVQIW